MNRKKFRATEQQPMEPIKHRKLVPDPDNKARFMSSDEPDLGWRDLEYWGKRGREIRAMYYTPEVYDLFPATEPVGSVQHKKFIDGIVNNPVPPYNKPDNDGSMSEREQIYYELSAEADQMQHMPAASLLHPSTIRRHLPELCEKHGLKYEGPDWPNRHPDSQRFHDLLDTIGKLHDQKQSDYGLSEQPFYNLECAHEWGLPSWMGIMIRISDKVRRLRAYVRNGKLLNESMEDSLMDIAVYALAAIVVNEKDQRANKGACAKPKPHADFSHEESGNQQHKT